MPFWKQLRGGKFSLFDGLHLPDLDVERMSRRLAGLKVNWGKERRTWASLSVLYEYVRGKKRREGRGKGWIWLAKQVAGSCE